MFRHGAAEAAGATTDQYGASHLPVSLSDELSAVLRSSIGAREERYRKTEMMFSFFLVDEMDVA